MAFKVILPKLGTNIDRAKILNWHKKEGDTVIKGEMLLEIETGKAVFEVEAESSGMLRKILASEGSEVDITRTIAVIAESSEDISTVLSEIKTEESRHGPSYAEKTWQNWYSGKDQRELGAVSSQEKVRAARGASLRMSPAARRLLVENKLDAESVSDYFAGKKNILQVEDIKEFLGAERIVIYGAGLGAKQALEIIRLLNGLKVVGLVDDNEALRAKEIHGHRVTGGLDTLKELWGRKEIDSVVLSFHSVVRRKLFRRIKEEAGDIRIKSLVDPRAIIGMEVEIGEGVFVEAGAIVGPGTKIGDSVIVDLGSVICHDCFVGAHSHISPGAHISGIVSIGENVLVGVGASVNSTVTIGKNVIVTPGSAVMNDIPADVVVSGVPAQVIGKSQRGRE